MVNISVVYGNLDIANNFTEHLNKKYKTLKVFSTNATNASHASHTIELLQKAIESPAEYRAFVVYGLDDANINTALPFASFFENLFEVRRVVFVIECENADTREFISILDPPMVDNPRYLTGSE